MKGGRLWLVVGIIVAIIGGALWFVVSNQSDMPDYAQQARDLPTTPAAGDAPTASPGKYIEYSDAAYANAEGRRWLFFHAGWCPQCRALEQDIQQQGVPDGVTILKVNYDTETDLKKKYGVTLQTTVVEVDAQGNKIQSFVAYNDPTMQSVTNALGG